jgi:hypothetical protein
MRHSPIQACVHYGSGCRCLNQPHTVTRRIILQKARCRGERLRAPTSPTAWKHTISGSISLPSPGCFSPFPHGTVRYRLVGVSSLGRWSPQLPTGYFVPGRTQEHQHTRLNFPYPAITVFGGVFQTPSGRASAIVCSSAELRLVSYNPIVARAAALAPGWFGRFPVRSPLLRGYCLFLGLREMFQLARCPPHKCGAHQR